MFFSHPRFYCVVAESGGRIVGSNCLDERSALAYLGHAVAKTNLDLQALVASAESFSGPGIIVPMRNSDFCRWCLESGLRIVEPMTLITIGLYNDPAGACLLSILS